MAPRVFISHASEDKDRFVVRFAERLLQRGVDAWLDRWEMLPGDSLVDKIFEEGIKNASAVIVVLSKSSVTKPWVKEELNAGFVQRVATGSKLIPVVIDDCDIPVALQSTLWVRVKDLTSYDETFEQIVASIFGTKSKPPVGNPPGYVQSVIANIGGLSHIDSLVFKLACEHALQKNERWINPADVFSPNRVPSVPESELIESLEILDGEGYTESTKHLGPGPYHFQVTTYGFRKYAEAYIPKFDVMVLEVIAAIVNKDANSNEAIRRETNIGALIVDHVLDELEAHGYIKTAKSLGGLTHIFNVSPALKRKFGDS